MHSATIIDQLRSQVAAIEGVVTRHGHIPFVLAEIDKHLPGGGLASGALHEITGGTELADDAAATIFLARIDGPVFWCLRWRDLFAPALGLAGLHPDRLIHVEPGSDTNALLATEECLRLPGLVGEVGEVGEVSTTAIQRPRPSARTRGRCTFWICGSAPACSGPADRRDQDTDARLSIKGLQRRDTRLSTHQIIS